MVDIDPMVFVPAPVHATPKWMVPDSLPMISAYLLLFCRSVQENIIWENVYKLHCLYRRSDM